VLDRAQILALAPTGRWAHVALLRRLRPVELNADMSPDFGRERHMRLISMLALAAATAVITGQASALSIGLVSG
jgi:hypothetical protein